MRKIIFSVIAVCMVVSLTACGSSGTKDKETDSKTITETDFEGGMADKGNGFYAQFEGSEYTECTDDEGKTFGELAEKGYSYMGYAGMNGKYYIMLTDGDYDYSVIPDDSASEIIKNVKTGASTDEVTEMLKDCIAEKCYSKEAEALSYDFSKYTVRYKEFEGKTIGEMAEAGYMIKSYEPMGKSYGFLLKGEDGEKCVVTLDSTFSDKEEELSIFLSDEETLELLKDCSIVECLKRE